MKIVVLVSLLFCVHIKAGFISSAVGGAIGGYAGAKVGQPKNIPVSEPIVSMENIVSLEIPRASYYPCPTMYDETCGKIKLCKRISGGCVERWDYKWITVNTWLELEFGKGAVSKYEISCGGMYANIKVYLK